MARKNPFANLMEPGGSANSPSPAPVEYKPRGASKSLMNSLTELAATADRLTAGEAIVELDPDLVDASFVKDRVDEDPEAYAQLRDAIRENGQNSPILVRPHPGTPGRYMIVFGHRRASVARELGKPVRAVVRELKDIEHVIAQGQENSARANLSFIEKALFAGSLAEQRYDNQVIMAALSVTPPTLSVMQSVAGLPVEFIEALNSAKSVGRNRWYELKQLLEKPSLLIVGRGVLSSQDFLARDHEARFELLIGALKASNKVPRNANAASKTVWRPESKALAAEILEDDKKFSLALKSKKGSEARNFGRYLTDRLGQLYDDFRKESDATDNGA